MLRSFVPVRAAAVLLLLPALAGAAHGADVVDTDPLNRQPAVQEAFQKFYEMDYEGALPRFEAIQREHPNDPIATAYVLDAVLFRELNRLDLLDTTFYANDGFLSTKHGVVGDPKVRDRIQALADQAVNQANAELKANPNDVNALFARGWTKSLQAIYSGLAERAFTGGLKEALGARSDCDRVLQLDPKYTDAELIVGVDQYVVGALPFAFKVLIGFVGIHGTKGEGLALLHDDAEHGVLTRVEANTAMMLFLRRERRYQQAVQIARVMAQQYPHDYLFHLEEANLEKDAGNGEAAVNDYEQVIDLAKRPGFYPNAHLELAYFGLGDTLRGRRSYAAAVAAFRDGADQSTTSSELKRRCLLEAGKTFDLMHEHNQAVEQYQAVLSQGPDSAQGDQARKYIHSAYTGK
ncbi:MAG TPA: tetratricopeptide repeat protein [Acidobacteriaceae bacterium]|jgi:tetratricopeptide (TPR) repeat protein|nr:tetratricopeptide repeat protein [Acidobacteriaceae bacterium]